MADTWRITTKPTRRKLIDKDILWYLEFYNCRKSFIYITNQQSSRIIYNPVEEKTLNGGERLPPMKTTQKRYIRQINFYFKEENFDSAEKGRNRKPQKKWELFGRFSSLPFASFLCFIPRVLISAFHELTLLLQASLIDVRNWN